MARTGRLVAGLAVVAFAAMGCHTAQPRPGPGQALADQTVEVAGTWSGVEQQHFRAVLDAFARRTGVTVTYTSGGNDLPMLLNSRLAGGAPPDIAMIPQPGVVRNLARRGVLKPLSGDAAAAVRANFAPTWQSLGTIDATLYGFHFKVANKSVIWYRPDAFAEAGVSPPTTWSEFTTVSRALADAGVTPMVAAGGDGWVLTDWFENLYLRVAGPDNYDRLSRHELPWTDPTVVRTLELLAGYWRAPGFVAGGPAGAVQVTFTQAIADVFGERPRAAMLFEGDFVAAEVTKLGRFTVGGSARYFPWPSIDGSPPAVVAAGDLAVAFKDSPAANALMAFLAGPEAAAIMAAQGGFLSPNRELDPATYPDPVVRDLASSVVNAKVLRFDLSDLTPLAFGGATNAHMWVLLQDFLGGLVPPATLAQQLEEAATKDFGSD